MTLNIFAMPSSSIVLLLSAAFGISNALPWSGPEPTLVYRADEWSPRPTNAAIGPGELFGRSVDVSVCGWLGGNSADPAVCPSGSSCIHDQAHTAIGCCRIGADSCTEGVYTSCVDKKSKISTTSGVFVQNNGVYTWYVVSASSNKSYQYNTNRASVRTIRFAIKIHMRQVILSGDVDLKTRLRLLRRSTRSPRILRSSNGTPGLLSSRQR